MVLESLFRPPWLALLLLVLVWRVVLATEGAPSSIHLPHVFNVLEQIFDTTGSRLPHAMPIKRLELLEVLVIDLFRIRIRNQLEVVVEVQTNDIQVEVLLQYFVGLQELVVLLLHVHLDLGHVIDELISFLHPFLGELLFGLVQFLLHRLLFKICLISQ